MTEKIDRLAIIDEAISYISPELIVDVYSPEKVLPVIKLAQLALSVFHPDRDIQENDVRGLEELTKINRLVGQFENNSSLAEMLLSTSKEIVDDVPELIRNEIELTKAIVATREKITVLPDSYDSLRSQLVPTGEIVENQADQKLLALFLGKNIISLIANAGEGKLTSLMPLLKKKLLKDFNGAYGISQGEWIALFDEISQADSIDMKQLKGRDIETSVASEVAYRLRERRFQQFENLVELLKPNDKLKYPENWYRSFNGTIVCPSDLPTWLNYEYSLMHNKDPELVTFNIHKLQNGVVVDSLKINTKERESIELIKDIKDENQKKWIKHLINYVAPTIGYEINAFTKVDKKNPKVNNPMDFLFEVTDNQSINILYTRPIDKKQIRANLDSITFDDIDFPARSTAIDPGFYMIKAGKNPKSKKYNIKPPLALIKLYPLENDQYIGTSLAMGSRVTLSGNSGFDSFIEDVDSVPAYFGQTSSFRNEKLFNIVENFIKFSSDSKSSIERSIFINNHSLLTHLIFLSNQEKVFSQTALSGHQARLIKSK